jgi:membrane fusion protein (multidrug efflux system)
MLVGGTVLVVVASLVYYAFGGRFVSTDDAYTQSARAEISANISGRVSRIFVKDNQQVHKGDPLFELDNREYVIAVEDAKAKLASARLEVAALKATYRERQADVKAAEETLSYREREYEREKSLAAKGISSQEQLDAAQHALVDAQQKLSAAREQQMNLRALLANKPDINVNSHPTVQQAQAALEQQALNLSYTLIKAPMDGVVSKVDLLQVGDYIRAASPAFSLLSEQTVWVEANFKETELANMRTGQQATIEVDAYPDHRFHGRVESLSPGTGASFSLLPPENATGNWVKVVQRLPVRISIDDADPRRPIHAGLSVTVEVDTLHRRIGDYWR